MTGFSHRRLVDRDQLEVARFVAGLLRDAELRDGVHYVQLNAALALPVEHDADGRCCSRESWLTTVVQLVAAEARDRGAAAAAARHEAIPPPALDTIEQVVEQLAADIDEGHRAGVPLPFTGAQLCAHYEQLLRDHPRAVVLADLHRRWLAQGFRRVHPLTLPHPDLARASDT